MFRRNNNHAPLDELAARLKQANLWDAQIRSSFKGLVLPTKVDIDYCIRPKRELMDLQRRLQKEYGSSVIPRTNPVIDRGPDSVAIFYASARNLEFQSHRFTFSDDGTTGYHKEPYNVDVQAFPSRRVDLSGLEAIVKDDQAFEELNALAQILEGAQPDEWQPRPELGRIAVARC
jgi:hypothetical protein